MALLTLLCHQQAMRSTPARDPQSALPCRVMTTTTSASSRSRLPQDQTFDIHFQLTVVVEVYTLFLTVEKGGLQCAAHCARLTLLEIMQELLKRQMPAVPQGNPNTFCERFHHYFVILGPSI